MGGLGCVGDPVGIAEDLIVDGRVVGDDQLLARVILGIGEGDGRGGLAGVLVDGRGNLIVVRDLVASHHLDGVFVDGQAFGCDVLNVIRVGIVAGCGFRHDRLDGVGQLLANLHGLAVERDIRIS